MSAGMLAVAPPKDPFVDDVRPYAKFDERGRVYAHGAQPVGFTWMLIQNGELRLAEDPLYDDEGRLYLTYAVKDDVGAWSLRPRPELGKAFDTLALAVNQEARIEDLPEAMVTFTGPVSSTEPIAHPGGLFEIGWTVPGEYLVILDCWPCLPATFTFTVS